MTDLGSFAAQTESMRSQAAYWELRAGYADSGRDTISPGSGKGYQFGFLAGLAGVSSGYNTWMASMVQAATDAADTARWMQAAMNSAADAYDGADNTSAADLATLDAMIEES